MKPSPQKSADFTFILQGFTPETLSVHRLAQYLEALANLLGSRNHVHFSAIEQGSAVLKMWVDDVAEPVVQDRLQKALSHVLPAKEKDPVHALEKLVQEDQTNAELIHGETPIIQFTGNSRRLDSIGPIKDFWEHDGILTGVVQREKAYHLQLTEESETIKATTTNRQLVDDLVRCFFKEVRLAGEVTRSRNQEGKWKIDSFRVDRFELIDENTFGQSLAGFRDALRGSEWLTMEDPWQVLHEMRRDD